MEWGKKRSSNESTKEQLIKAASYLFAQNGYSGTSVKQICAQAHANAASVNYHFDGKEGLYLAVLQTFKKDLLNIAIGALSKPQTKSEFLVRLEIFMERLLDGFLQNSNVIRIVLMESRSDDAHLGEGVRSTLSELFNSLNSFFSSASEQDLIRQDITPQVISIVICSQFLRVLHADPISGRLRATFAHDIKSRKKWIHSILRIILYGALDNQKLDLAPS